jgi:hypothetical protein
MMELLERVRAPIPGLIVAPERLTRRAAAIEIVVWADAGQEVAISSKTISAVARAAIDLRAWTSCTDGFGTRQMEQRGCYV